MKPLKERIREILCNWKFGETQGFVCENRVCCYKEDCKEALQAILTEIKENLPERRRLLIDMVGYETDEDKGYNAYHDEMERTLEAQTKKLE